MGTTIRSELSKSNKHWIDRHRYYELKHFCLQYPIWKKHRAALDGYVTPPMQREGRPSNCPADPTANTAEARIFYTDRIELLEQTANDTDSVIGCYILLGVTEGVSYDIIRSRLDIPCCKDVYYDLYRKFFWLLNKARK